ncbi:MAG: hypothetical protein AB7G40_09425 [Hyphomonadaceae bacterium]
MDQVASSPEQVDPSDQNDETLHEDLEEAVRTTLQTHDLPPHEDAVEYVVEMIVCARMCAVEWLGERRMDKRAATKLRNAMRTGIDTALKYRLVEAEDLTTLRRLRRLAEVEILMPPAQSGPRIRPWLWFWCEEFLEIWRRTTDRQHGVWMTDADNPSPALGFLVDCCRLVDPTVNASAILYAKEHAGPRPPNAWEVSHADFATWSEQQHDTYNKLWQSEWMQKLHEHDL